ncbi:MAG: MBL fold metallo-hydrolase [Patescibacteria group bacterium]|nr:MBL fold metallo-hydrolase [Patescibacteria group bacterium]
MKIKILGSGAWQGIPAPFCSCKLCQLAVKNLYCQDARTRPQFMVETRQGSFLIEVSPDIRTQSTRFSLPAVNDFVVSHWHFDHMYGLHELLTWLKSLEIKPVVHGSLSTKDKIEKEFSYLPFDFNLLEPYKKINLCGVDITPLPLYHAFGIDEELSEEEINNTFAYLLEYEGKRVVYLSDYYKIQPKILDKIKGVDVLIADGTYLFTDKFKGIKLNHMHNEGILQLASSIGAKQVYFHSISHLTGLNHQEMQAKLPENYFISYDGLEIDL